MILRGELEFNIEDRGVVARAGEKSIRIIFDPKRFRSAEVPILLSDTKKIEGLGFKKEHIVRDIGGYAERNTESQATILLYERI